MAMSSACAVRISMGTRKYPGSDGVRGRRISGCAGAGAGAGCAGSGAVTRLPLSCSMFFSSAQRQERYAERVVNDAENLARTKLQHAKREVARCETELSNAQAKLQKSVDARVPETHQVMLAEAIEAKERSLRSAMERVQKAEAAAARYEEHHDMITDARVARVDAQVSSAVVNVVQSVPSVSPEEARKNAYILEKKRVAARGGGVLTTGAPTPASMERSARAREILAAARGEPVAPVAPAAAAAPPFMQARAPAPPPPPPPPPPPATESSLTELLERLALPPPLPPQHLRRA